MQVTDTAIPDVKLVEPRLFGDERGFFYEFWNRERYAAAGLPHEFIQDNISRSAHATLRGLHFQFPTMQGKLVSVLTGTIFDVAVDIRKGSPSFGKWVGAELSDANRHQLWVPKGFAHGFVVVSETADVMYKVDGPYRPDEEYSLAYNDPALGIDWPVAAKHLSAKDADALALADLPALPEYGKV